VRLSAGPPRNVHTVIIQAGKKDSQKLEQSQHRSFQIGITVLRSLGHHCRGRGTWAARVPPWEAGQGAAPNAAQSRTEMAHTVDGDGDALGEDKAISADEGRDLVEGVGLEELLGRLGGVDLDLLKLEVVGLRNGADGRGAGVALCRAARSATGRVNKQRALNLKSDWRPLRPSRNVPGRRRAFRTPSLLVVWAGG
jgi:hypothetical protein